MIGSIQPDLVLLRTLRSGDRAEFVRMHGIIREHFGPWMPTYPPGESLGDIFHKGLINDEKGAREKTGIRLAAILPDGRMAGIFALSQIFRGAFQNAHAAWRVSADQLPPRYRHIGLHRVQANVIPSNRASVRVAEKAGFRLEGEAKDYLKIDGRWQDHLMFAKLAEEHRGRLDSPSDS